MYSCLYQKLKRCNTRFILNNKKAILTILKEKNYVIKTYFFIYGKFILFTLNSFLRWHSYCQYNYQCCLLTPQYGNVCLSFLECTKIFQNIAFWWPSKTNSTVYNNGSSYDSLSIKIMMPLCCKSYWNVHTKHGALLYLMHTNEVATHERS